LSCINTVLLFLFESTPQHRVCVGVCRVLQETEKGKNIVN